MSRELPEWIGESDDTTVPPRVRMRVLDRGDYKCACCGTQIAGKPWDVDHIVALKNGGANRESNLQPLLAGHHKEKTRQDVAEKSKTYRVRSKHHGIRKRTNFRGWRKMDGTLVYAADRNR